MIGSPDLLAFTGTEGFGEGEEEEALSLPEDLSVPLFPSFHPWTTSAQFHRDFILVAEFSEQVGPKPVLTIPEDQKVIGSFDLNHFSVRIMSVDYQASGPCHAPPPSPGPRLNFSEDSKVILGDSADDAFAYVHHMTLYDLEARGMVRPFCMAYVCSDQSKLMENLAELSACFSQASDSLKTGNRQAFSTELQRKLQELEYRRLSLLQEAEAQRTLSDSTDGDGKGEELEAVERLILNHRELLRQVTSYPNRKLKQPDFLPYDPADSLTDPMALLLPDTCSSLATSASCRSEHHLKPLQELCNTYFLSLMRDQLADAERRLRGDRSVLRTHRVTRALSRRLKLTNFLFELLSPEDGEEMEAEGAELEQHGVSGRNGRPEKVQAEPQSLESFFSCVEEIPIKLVAVEAVEAGTVTPDPAAAAEMTESVSSGDSIEVLGTEKSFRTQHIVVGPDSRETAVGAADACIRHAPVDAGVRRMRAYAKRANSEDSIEVLSTTESIFPDDLTAITEEEAELHSFTNGYENEEESQSACPNDKDLNQGKAAESQNELEVEGLVHREDATEETVVGGPVMTKDSNPEVHRDTSLERTYKLLQGQAAAPWPEAPQKVRSAPLLRVNFAHPAALAELEQRSPPCAPLRLLSVDETSDCTSFTGSSDPPSPTQNDHSKTHLDRRRRRKAGLRALRFIKQNSFSQHAVFCLLSGRPLVVIGGDETLVRKLVGALRLFLPAPGPDGSAVMPCLATPLQLIDLLTWRLIGIHRTSSSSSVAILHSLSRYSRYLALLDLDQKTLRSPSYSGSLLGLLTSPHTGFSRGITYLLHVESCLTALANQVLLQTFVPAVRRPSPAAGEGGAEGKDSPHAQGFSGSDSDSRVMHFLSDLIKQHHVGRGPPVLRFSYCSVHLHKNTNAT